MIYTLTANPAIDYNIACDGLSANTVTRTRNAVYTPNGKGLNVSFTLDHYGVDTTILGFFAGFSGEFIVKGAEALGVPVKPVWTDGITRVNVFLNAGPDTEYNMVNAGAAINEANEQEMFELIDSLDDMTCLVISGSLPPNTSEGFLAEVLRRVKAKGAEFVLDISSHQLADLIAMEPLLIKPNDDELLDIFGIKVSGGDDESVKGAMAELHAKGAKNVLLTLGGAGAYFSNGEHIWFANRTFEVKLLSTVCAGDSSLAAFLSVWHDAPERVEDACASRWPPALTWSSALVWAILPRWTNTRSTSKFVRSASRIDTSLPNTRFGSPRRVFFCALNVCGVCCLVLSNRRRDCVCALSRFLLDFLQTQSIANLIVAGGHRHVQCFAQRYAADRCLHPCPACA